MNLRVAARFAWLVVVALVLLHGRRLGVVGPLTAVCIAAFVGWVAAMRPPGRPAAAAAALVVLGVAAAVVAVWSSAAIGFLVAAGVAAGSSFPLRRAVPVAIAGPVVVVLASAAAGWSNGLVLGSTGAALGGLVGGIARRQGQDRAEQEARVVVARELHDVLAHTLGALAVQLEALDAVTESGDREHAAELLRRARALVSRGLDETAEAVRALRDEPVPVAERIAALVDASDASLRIEGTPRPLPPKPGLALYRAAQEAITNARKHAPGTPAELTLAFRDGQTVLTVTNAAPGSPAVAPGAGLGLQGMRERLELAGGRLETGATAQVFTVEAAVPA